LGSLLLRIEPFKDLIIEGFIGGALKRGEHDESKGGFVEEITM